MTDELTATLREIISRLDALGIDYMLVGSVAALAHGRARSTQDFDVVVEPDATGLRALLKSLPAERFYASEVALNEALSMQSQFNIIDMDTGWKVDVIPRKRREFSQTEFDAAGASSMSWVPRCTSRRSKTRSSRSSSGPRQGAVRNASSRTSAS